MNSFTAKVRGLLAASLVACLCASPMLHAETQIMNIAGAKSLVNHYPGPDGLIGTADDVVSEANTAEQQSAANVYGTSGYNSFTFSMGGGQDPGLPEGFDAITFVEGTVTADLDVLANGGGAVITAMNITSGTEPFPGHGAYSSTITAVNDGTYNPATGAFMLDVDISFKIFGFTGTEPGVVLTGTAVYRKSSDFGMASGNAYVDDFAVPFAQAAGASSVLYLKGSGMLTNLSYPITASLVALDGNAFRINAGLNDAWFSFLTDGQGVFLVVYPDLGTVFIAMFTYDTSRPPQDVMAILGEPGHRWISGYGSFTGNQAVLEAILTTGGVFDAGDPEPEQVRNYGTYTLTFNHCNELILQYNFPTLNLSGTINMTRLANDNIALCDKLNKIADQ